MGSWVCFYFSFFLFHSQSNVYSCVQLLVFVSRCFGISELNVPQINDGGGSRESIYTEQEMIQKRGPGQGREDDGRHSCITRWNMRTGKIFGGWVSDEKSTLLFSHEGIKFPNNLSGSIFSS